MSESVDEKAQYVIMSLSKERLNSEHRRREALDSKASIMLTLNGVIASLLMGLGSTILKEKTPQEVGSVSTTFAFVLSLGIIFFVGSALCALVTLLLRNYPIGPTQKWLSLEFKKKTLYEFYASVSKVYEAFANLGNRQNYSKAIWLYASFILSIGGIILIFAAAVLTLKIFAYI